MEAGEKLAWVSGGSRSLSQCHPACVHHSVPVTSSPKLPLHQHPAHTCPLLEALGFRISSVSFSILASQNTVYFGEIGISKVCNAI